MAASEILQKFVSENAEQMPHKSRTTIDGSRETQKVLPAAYTQEILRADVNTVLKQIGIPNSVSTSAFNKMWNTDFKDVTISKHSSFSKCDTCTELKDQIRASKTIEEAEVVRQKMKVHMDEQRSCRNQYYGNRVMSEAQPSKYLCLIHDKMDQAKTCIPRLQQVPKSCQHEMQLPISLTGNTFSTTYAYYSSAK